MAKNTPSLVVSGRRVVTPEGTRPADILIQNGVISEILPQGKAPAGKTRVDAGNLVVMPGLVDTHVHVNEPGRTEWEGFETATKAAAAGGITTLIDMPLNSTPVTTTAEALKIKLEAARGRCWVDCGFWGGVVPGNAGELEAMIDAGVRGFKAFLIHSGIDDFPNASRADLEKSMPILARRGVPLLVHAELEGPVENAGACDARLYAGYLNSRPKAWENEAMRLMIELCRQTGCRVHIVHLSSSQALGALKAARAENLPLTAETCPHYLTFASESIPDGATEYKCAPPIREKENREKLWEALGSGLIDFVVSDHSPCAPDLKKRDAGDFHAAWGGISSVQFGLPAVWTQARARGRSFEDLARWLCKRPALFAGLKQKGKIAAGFDADLVLWDPEASFTLDASMIKHRHKLTPYDGLKLNGVVAATFLRGEKIYEKGKNAGAAKGRLLLN